MRIGIGIPVFQSFEPQVAFDYMRMFYSFGRRYQEYDFVLITKVKSEQFRARNAIVETALQFGLDYLLFLDDDQVFNWLETRDPGDYEFLRKLLSHKKPIVGALYYHRGGDFKPVLMTNYEDGKYRFLTDAEITGGLQEVDVQGGGVMLIDMKIFDKILPPYFEPEMQTDGNNLGTDVQLCKKAKEAGFSVWCDTSIVVGHMMAEPQIITHMNRDSFFSNKVLGQSALENYFGDTWVKGYQADIEEYTGYDVDEIYSRGQGERYANVKEFPKYKNLDEYYVSRGVNQLCRQYWYHDREEIKVEGTDILKHFRGGKKLLGLDFGCGSAPIGYEVLKMGHYVDFVDIDGAGGFEFLKWRIKNKLEPWQQERAGYKIEGPYDFVLFLDVIEHLENWEEILDNIIGRISPNGTVVTNYFANRDYDNIEHINMDHRSVMQFFVSRHLIPRTYMYWHKDDNYLGGAMSVKNISKEEVDDN